MLIYLSLNTYQLEIHHNVYVRHAGLLHTQLLFEGRFIQDEVSDEQELSEQGNHCWFVVNWHIDYFAALNGAISISQNRESASYLLRSEKQFFFIEC